MDFLIWIWHADRPHRYWREDRNQPLHVIANELNVTFQSVFSKECLDNNNDALLNASILMPNIVLTAEGILSPLLNIDVKISTGADGIRNAFLKRYSEMMSQYLFVLFSVSLKQSSLPRVWLIAKMVPAHKFGDKRLTTNYRPISLTSTCCKLPKHIRASHITKFLE